MARKEIFGRVATLVVGTVDVSDLRITFNVTRSRKKSPNIARISVYNLSRARINELRQVTTGTRVLLSAGYKAPIGTSQIFAGELRNANVERVEADLVFTLESGDGDKAYTSGRLNQSFAPGTRMSDVIGRVAGSTGLGRGNLDGLLDKSERIEGTGMTVQGSSIESLDKLLKPRGLSFSVQDGVIQASKEGAPVERTAILVNSDTGMIGSPSRGADGIVKVTMPILPEIVPGRVIRIDAEFVTGDFVIERTSTDGDTADGPWQTAVEGSPYKP